MHDKSSFESVTPELWLANEQEWREKLLSLPNWNQIPLINCNASHNLPSSTLVRFKGMVQDMHSPEFYFEQFEIYNTATNEIKNKSGKYRDTANILENEKINYTQNLKSSQRQTIVVVSIPGLNAWAEEIEHKQNHLKHLEQQPNTSKRLNDSNSTKLKRAYDETDEDPDAMEVVDAESAQNKERKSEESTTNESGVVSREHLLNFPLPDMPSQSCIVKFIEAIRALRDLVDGNNHSSYAELIEVSPKMIYEESDNIKINELVEVVGFLSVDPALSGEFQKEKDALVDPVIESEAEAITHNPPPSLVPRVHAVYVKKLEHCNPLVVQSFDQDAVLKEANKVREHLLKALTELLLGDKLAAEYLICHLIACVYLRQDGITLGQFCLNISNLPTQKYPSYAKQLYDIVKQFVTKSYYLPLTIENMNTLCLLPKKDYDCNRLTSGVLQLSKDTHLVLDETKMEQGTLDATGVSNVTALASVINHQRVEYDFKYYKMEFESDISILILSEGKSLLPSDYHVPLRPEESSLEIFNAIVEAATYYLKEDIMNTIRTYLTSIKHVKYCINEDIKFVEEDFIEMRNKSDPENPVTADDLHRLLVLTRLVSLSRGHDHLKKECWELTKAMEVERLHRIKNRVPA